MLLTVKETAEFLRISERYTYELIKKNKLPHIKLGGKILCDKDSLLVHLKSIEKGNEEDKHVQH
ncbi:MULTISPECIES: helix-turn-helix domain-containing protein [Mammaliicoccus]|uniref:helix-turn-helix domain-containing protein n=1 Tax=Mammaliicoccus TaxID=2803850 RepID=UPI000D1ECAB9|nr:MULTISPECIES: helix-turn-helix domain-containing protein [Mammaliicoccus]MBO3062012.1 helix-turn-helix domain-containing protein [Mammaliicoccus fleurettii]PTI34566.1 DNA-binding protein [Mammaliicoccus vitulinus]